MREAVTVKKIPIEENAFALKELEKYFRSIKTGVDLSCLPADDKNCEHMRKL